MKLSDLIKDAFSFKKKKESHSEVKSLSELILESEASDQAKQMGLVYKSFGRYGPSDGKTTHKSQGGKLVPIGKDTPSAEPEKPTTKAAPQEIPSDSADKAPEPHKTAEPKKEPEKKATIPKEASEVFTDEKLSSFMSLGNKIATLASQLEQLNKDYGEQTQEMLDEFDRTNQKVTETENFIAKMARRQSLRTTQSYQVGFQFLLDKVNAELKKAAEAALKATEKITYIRGKVDIRKKEPIDESETDIKSITDETTKNIRNSNNTIDTLLMLMKVLTGKEEKNENSWSSGHDFPIDHKGLQAKRLDKIGDKTLNVQEF
jgi:hypothetical protein